MKLKKLKSILYSYIGAIQWAIVYDDETNEDLTHGCSIEYAISNYGECNVKRISSYYDVHTEEHYLVITI